MLPMKRLREPRPKEPFILRRFLARMLRMFLFIILVLLALGWTLPPIIFTSATLHPPRFPVRTDPATLSFPVESVAFPSAEGFTLRGWFGRKSASAPVILLGHGYPANREQMIPYAALLYDAGYSVLLLDWRAWGESGGTLTTFGLHEADDLRRAMDYLTGRPDLQHPRFGGLGVSMGAGLMLIGAAYDHRLAAVVCDSSYARVGGMFGQWNSIGLTVWPHRIPFAPLGEPTANVLLEGHLAEIDPITQAAAVSPSALLLVHAEHDGNGLTPLSGAQAIYATAKEPKAIWISPTGNHAGIIQANPDGYRAAVIPFLDKYLRDTP